MICRPTRLLVYPQISSTNIIGCTKLVNFLEVSRHDFQGILRQIQNIQGAFKFAWNVA